jgi:hypothetical protein
MKLFFHEFVNSTSGLLFPFLYSMGNPLLQLADIVKVLIDLKFPDSHWLCLTRQLPGCTLRAFLSVSWPACGSARLSSPHWTFK